MKNNFISITDLSEKEILYIFDLAIKIKKEHKMSGINKSLLNNKSMIMIFEKPSLRTRLSFEIGMSQLGGKSIFLTKSDIGIGEREQISDIAKTISTMGDFIVARTFKHKTIEELAAYSAIPVINGLSDFEHPCQALTDFFTVLEIKGKLSGLTIAYLGDAKTNVAHSLCLGSAILGINFKYAAPKEYWMDKKIINKAKKIAEKNKTIVTESQEPEKILKEADVVVTDTWVSMGNEKENDTRTKKLRLYQVDQKLMSSAKNNAIFMHCLPAYRGREVAAEVIDGDQSVVFQEAENRLHVQKALLVFLMLKKLKNNKNDSCFQVLVQ